MSESHYSPEHPDAPARPSLFAANALYLLAAAGLVLTPRLLAPLAAALLARAPDLRREVLLLGVTLIYYLFCVALPVIHYTRTRGLRAAMRLQRPLAPSAALLSALAAALCLPLGANLTLLWEVLLARLGLALSTEGLYIPGDTTGLLVCVLYMAMIPGICEELAFRGLVLGAWERRGRLRALCVSTALFASLHGSIDGLPAHLLLGGALGLLALGSDSLYAGMIFHTFYNALVLLTEFAARRLNTAPEAEALAFAADPYGYLGGAAGLAGTGLRVLLLTALLALLLRGVWRIGVRAGVRPVQPEKGSMTWQELLVLLSGIVTALFLYGSDLIDMLKGSL